jgi:error-prone DNA polymerase
MVMCDRPVIEVCPVEWARMDRRSVLQWDKDDCAAAGLVKFDLLGLGMLEALHHTIDLVNEHGGHEGELVDLAKIPHDDTATYEMLSRADSVGVFQVESRAQMGTLPRLKPENFYDLVIEVALIRPGPIQGGSVHPYLHRRKHRDDPEEITYLHPRLKGCLERTLGVPLFQEQLMQMAIDVADFTPAEADELRRAMGAKRSRRRMEGLRERLYAGMARYGITEEAADEIYVKMVSFADYGFPESHSVSFAYLVCASAWLKCHHPAAFLAGLLRAQPLGFWSPHSLTQDARRHGVVVLGPDLNASEATVALEPCPASTGDLAVRLGIGSIRSIGTDVASAIAAGRPYESVEELVRRVPALRVQQLETMATAGAFDVCFGPDRRMDRRAALWAVGAASESRPDRLGGLVTESAPHLPGMEPVEVAIADLWATGIAADGHPTRFVRDRLDELGVTPASCLGAMVSGRRVTIAGIVTHRQRPMTAQGTTFMNLEDETGLMNVVISKGCWARHRRTARGAAALVIRGRVESSEGVVNVVADSLTALTVPAHIPSRDFR